MAQNRTYTRYGEIFLTQGRPHFCYKTCVTFCTVTYKSDISNDEFDREFVKERNYSLRYMRSLHAEEHIINEIEETERAEHW
jgi:hypothetical protein